MILEKRLANMTGMTAEESVRIVSLGFVLTDGQTKNKDALLEEVELLRRENVTVYSIGVGQECTVDTDEDQLDLCVNGTELEIIAGSTNRTHRVDQYEQLKDIMQVDHAG